MGWIAATVRARFAEAWARTQMDALRSAAAVESARLASEVARVPALLDEIAAQRDRAEASAVEAARATERLTAEKSRSEEASRQFTLLETRFREVFEALSGDALRRNNQAFLDLAKERLEGLQAGARQDLDARRAAIDALMEPVRKSLERMGDTLSTVEKERREAFGAMGTTLAAMRESQEGLRGETQRLVTALRAPQVRGRWGEIQLRRVVELAGMLEYCDFKQQTSVRDGDGGALRPDLVVRLPGGKTVVVDAKTPLEAYLRSVDATTDDERALLLKDHARQVRDHVTALGRKAYQDQFQPAPEFVVMFLPGETFFSAALQHDPSLIEYGVEKKVIPASPTTLIALLRSVSYGWQQERIAEEAERIHKLGRELHERIRVMAGHFGKVGDSLGKAVTAYNQTVASLESRVLVTARRFDELGVGGGQPLPELPGVSEPVRLLELPAPPSDETM
jgi:DNA recombination protein RmuC